MTTNPWRRGYLQPPGVTPVAIAAPPPAEPALNPPLATNNHYAMLTGQTMDFNVLQDDSYAGVPGVTLVDPVPTGVTVQMVSGLPHLRVVGGTTARTVNATYQLTASENSGSSQATATIDVLVPG